MEQQPTQTQDKQVTVDVPAERVPEFYAMYARFLAGRRRGSGRRGRGPGGHGHRPHGHGPCGHGARHPREQAAGEQVGEA
jgi:hypothetical protein